REDGKALHIGGELAGRKAQVDRDGQADQQQQQRAHHGRPQRDLEIGEAVAIRKEEGVGLEREAVTAVGAGLPDGAADRGEARPDDQPGYQKYRCGDGQEAVRPRAGFTGYPRNGGSGCGSRSHASRSTFGATLRYEPSLMAFCQSPPGKVGIDFGTMSAKRSRNSGDTWSQDTPGKPPSSVRMALWI